VPGHKSRAFSDLHIAVTKKRHQFAAGILDSRDHYVRCVASAFALILISSNALSAEKIETACQVIKTEIGDCDCAVRFLQETLGPEQGMVLLRVWAAGAGYLGDSTKAFEEIYRFHPPEAVLKTSSQFLRVETEFETECRPPGFIFFE
jgi:hypothetical protein